MDSEKIKDSEQITIRIRLSTYRMLQDQHDDWKTQQLLLERKDRAKNLSMSVFIDQKAKGLA